MRNVTITNRLEQEQAWFEYYCEHEQETIEVPVVESEVIALKVIHDDSCDIPDWIVSDEF